MSTIVIVSGEPKAEPVLAALKREYIHAVIQESIALHASCDATARATALDFGIQQPSIEFEVARQQAEAKTGSRFLKFFKS